MEPLLHVRRDLVDDVGAGREQQQPGDGVQLPPRGDVDHRQHDAVQQQRRAHVVHHRDNAERDAGHRQQRTEVPRRRQGDAEQPPVRHRQQLPALAQVAGQEDDEQQLGELARLHLHAADPDPELGPVDGGADDHGQQQQDDGSHPEGVLVRLQPPVVADEQDQRQEARHADHDPDRLVARQQRVQPVDLGQAHRRQQRGQREQPGIRVRQPRAQAEVRDEVQRQEEPRVHQRRAGDLLLARGVHAEEADPREEGDREQVDELAEPRRPHGCASPACSAVAMALDFERIVWSNSRLRVAWSSDA